MSQFPLIILLSVLAIIAVRQLLPIRLAIWQIMTAGAVCVLVNGSITLKHAFGAIDWDVIGFLFGVFIIAQGLEKSNALDSLLIKYFGKMNSGFKLLFYFMLISAIGSAVLMNDAIAIMGVPVIILLSKRAPQLKWPLFFALAFSVTIGSNLSPIGNPQNLLIANSGMPHPFWHFIKSLWLPSILNLAIAFGYLSFIYKKQLVQSLNLDHALDSLDNKSKADINLAKLSRISCLILVLLILIKILLDSFHSSLHLPFSLISVLACLPVILGSKQRFSLLKQIDWGTLLFFVSLFILISCVWQSGVLQTQVNHYGKYLLNLPTLMGVSVVGSQIVSNVPLVALYLPILKTHSADMNMYMALAASSTIAGNLSIIGAASNVIILQKFEKLDNFTLGFGKFFIMGLPLVLVNLLVYWASFNL